MAEGLEELANEAADISDEDGTMAIRWDEHAGYQGLFQRQTLWRGTSMVNIKRMFDERKHVGGRLVNQAYPGKMLVTTRKKEVK